MTVVKNILLVVYVIICIALILITTFQSKDNNNSVEDTYENPRFNKYYEKNKSRTKTGKLQKNTIILEIVFTVLTIVTGVMCILVK